MEILEGDKLVKRVELTSRIALLTFVVGGFVFGNKYVAFSIFLGGLLIVANFELLKRQMKKAFRQKGRIPSKASVFVKYYIRFFVLAVLILVLIKKGVVHPIWLLVGLSSIMVGIMIVAVGEFVKIFLKGEG